MPPYNAPSPVAYDDKDLFVFTILEHQSRPDHWIAFRLFEYALSLLRRHINSNKPQKLPLVSSIVYYNGRTKYNAPLNFFDLFDHPKLARELMTCDYKLINLQEISNEEIESAGHLQMLNFFMKNIWQRDMIKLWKEFLERFGFNIEVQQNRLYIKEFLCYTSVKLPGDKKPELTELIQENLSDKQKGEELMRSMAQEWFDEGIEKGVKRGIERGIAKGKAEGKVEGEASTITLMIGNGMTKQEICRATGFSMKHINYLLSLDMDHK